MLSRTADVQQRPQHKAARKAQMHASQSLANKAPCTRTLSATLELPPLKSAD